MSNLTPVAGWDDIRQLETSDPVLGGPGQIDNAQAQALLNRTEYLKALLGSQTKYTDVAVITADTTIDASYIGKVIHIVATGNLTITIDQQRNFAAHSVLHFVVSCVPNKCIKILPSDGEQIEFGNDQENELYLIDGEFLKLITNSSVSRGVEFGRFITDSCSQSLFMVGEEVLARALIKNTYALTGQEVSRADFARLWKWIERNLTDGHELINQSDWNISQNITNDAGVTETVYPYKGCFNKGNGSTTFQFPDERGMFIRVFDAGRGIDNDRLWQYPGGYEHDRVKSHKHNVTQGNSFNGAGGVAPVGRGNDSPNNKPTENVGGSENLVKSIAKLSMIRL